MTFRASPSNKKSENPLAIIFSTTKDTALVSTQRESLGSNDFTHMLNTSTLWFLLSTDYNHRHNIDTNNRIKIIHI